jgi:hypothetical protein
MPKKSFITLTTGVNVVTLFGNNYANWGHTF